MISRRRALALGAALPLAAPAQSAPATVAPLTESVPLDGPWSFRLDSQTEWRTVTVPHTWQIEPATADYMGVAWYRREFDVPARWTSHAVRVEFEAVFHSAVVLINGVEAGRHGGKGYTAFTIDATPYLHPAARNTITVRVDNDFNESMLPRGRSSDWAHDGGIYRPVRILVTPTAFVESLAVDADPDLAANRATLNVSLALRNSAPTAWEGAVTFHVIDDATGDRLPHNVSSTPVILGPRSAVTVPFPPVTLAAPELWHFDHPHLYRLRAELSSGHTLETTFGIRKIEVRGTRFFFNGEPVRLMGVERMAGSNPEFGMAEPAAWLDHDHADMKELNCVYTRVHWPQDARVLDWCDRHGILIQTEVPTWGGGTFNGMGAEPAPAIMQNGLEQLREMIARDRNHPCIFSWGLCNEINGQNPAAAVFARRMYAEAKRLDPRRLATYASNSLQKTPAKDVAGEMDYVMWNEYYESWYKGTPEQLAANLDEIHQAFPTKPIVISEYGYCACTADRPEGDARRTTILRDHDQVFRTRDYVAGLIFFDYNDYRTHVGDRGAGVLKQRVHGVVDVYGAKKPSWDALRAESSPVESLRVEGNPATLTVALKTRALVPAYTLRSYQLRAIAYASGNIPVERTAVMLPVLAPGESHQTVLHFAQPGIARIQVDLLRPTNFSAHTTWWGML